MFPIHTILHPTDFTEHSTNAFQLACALARDYGAKLTVLHVAPPLMVPFVNGGIYPVSMEVPRENLKEELNQLKVDPTIAVERVLAEGDPATEILRVAEDCYADLIVMGTHGRRALARLLMGSVAEGVVRKAPCPVLTIRGKLPMAVEEPAEAATEEPVEIC